ncbi:hypothetical protein [Streptomyces ipomoeae]|uniref:hypothetical protein n=1 Tax=Streptomyces ipomoeae TaxID=103232 RepID=UPI0029B09A23|nr:hypothetical protein [Streptomyces ipomoeae]MDX2692200.1 hypothetical protein [Streptomyces ipomoeae]MDX2839307.1 hypothetical protein [Streptomyces ipomoeae]
MATPAPEGDPFAESAGEGVQTAIMATRLVLAIADAIRRQRQKNTDEEPPSDQEVSETADSIKKLMPSDISDALLTGADWPQMAQQLVALRRAGVNLEQILPGVGEIAVTVRDQVAANEARVTREGTGEWERMLRETLPAGPVREAILSSPKWPDIAAEMARLDERGVDVRQVLASAHDAGLGVDQALAKALGAGSAPAASRDAQMSWGPLTTGLDIPNDLDLSDRARALRQLSIADSENERYARMVREAMPGREREAGLMVTARQWPLVAARMAWMENQGQPVTEHLARLMKDTEWEKGPGPQLGSRLVQAANGALRRPLGDEAGESRVRVNTTAARAQSATVGPTRPQAAKSTASAEPGVAPHRQTGPAPAKGKTK